MINRLKEIRKDELVRGSVILFIVLALFNFLNYVFHISIARILGPADFGILAALMSIAYILGIPGEAIQTISSKYTSTFSAKNDFGKIKDFFYRSLNKSILFALGAFTLLIPFTFLFSKLLNIKLGLLLITNLLVFYIFTIPIGRGILQGKKKFYVLGWSLIIEGVVKVIFAIIFVFAGLKVYGAIGGVWVGGIIAFAIVLIALRDIRKFDRMRASFSNVYRTNIPILVAVTAVVIMYSIDILFARAFFSAEVAGRYAFVSMIGKVIIFVSFAIGKALLPISSEDFERGKDTKLLFRKALILVCIISGIILAFYGIIPKTIIWLISLGSTQYVSSSALLFPLGLSYTLLSITNVVILYKVSINKMGRSWIFLIFSAIQALAWILFHGTVLEFAYSFVFVNAIMFLYSIFFIKR